MAASAQGGTGWLTILLSYWWLVFLVGGSVLASVLDTWTAREEDL